MQVRLCFVPCGGGEIDYVRDVDIPALPAAGDYVTVVDRTPEGTQGDIGTFRVRRRWWNVEMAVAEEPQSEPRQLSVKVFVECEFAKGPTATASHLRSYEAYAERAGTEVVFDSSMY
jgi:hypothetical protein